jgi:hypothetical protein
MRLLCLCALSAVGLLAHHALDAVYDRGRRTDFQAVVTKVEWLNPHAHFWGDVRMGGQTVRWEFELGSPNRLMRNGWSRYTVKEGDRITVSAIPARDGSPHAAATAIAFPDGRRMQNFDLFDE